MDNAILSEKFRPQIKAPCSLIELQSIKVTPTSYKYLNKTRNKQPPTLNTLCKKGNKRMKSPSHSDLIDQKTTNHNNKGAKSFILTLTVSSSYN